MAAGQTGWPVLFQSFFHRLRQHVVLVGVAVSCINNCVPYFIQCSVILHLVLHTILYNKFWWVSDLVIFMWQLGSGYKC